MLGDISGSRFEGYKKRPKTARFHLFTKRSRFTDDSVLTSAVAKAILEDYENPDFKKWIRAYGAMYPRAGYGARFRQWVKDPVNSPNDSYANGAPMRVSPIAWAYDDIYRIMIEARRSAETTHNHPIAIKASQIVAGCIYYARMGYDKGKIADFVRAMGYPIKECKDHVYGFDLEADKTVQQAISCFMKANDLVATIRYAISIGGDSDTIAAIAGSIAHAYYGISHKLTVDVSKRITPHLANVLVMFSRKYIDQDFLPNFNDCNLTVISPVTKEKEVVNKGFFDWFVI